MPLPLRYVDEIHARLAIRYGTAWSAKWQGLDQEAIRTDWADQLDGMSPPAIKAALANLPPEFPPTCTAFRKLGEDNANHSPDAKAVLALQDARGGCTPSPEVLARLRAIAGRSVRVVTDELASD